MKNDTYRLMNSNDLPDDLECKIRELLIEMSCLLVNVHHAVAFAALSNLVAEYIARMPKDIQERTFRDIPELVKRIMAKNEE